MIFNLASSNYRWSSGDSPSSKKTTSHSLKLLQWRRRNEINLVSLSRTSDDLDGWVKKALREKMAAFWRRVGKKASVLGEWKWKCRHFWFQEDEKQFLQVLFICQLIVIRWGRYATRRGEIIIHVSQPKRK